MIRVEHRKEITILHMEHGKANTIDIDFCREFVVRLDELAAASAIVVTGRESIFSAGVDLLKVLDGGADYIRQFLIVLDEFCDALFSFPGPMVAAVNGSAIAGGCVVACMADHRIMARDRGRIGVPELQVGLPFPAGPLEVMRFAVPKRFFTDVIYGGEVLEADAALQRGVVDDVVEADELLDRALEVAERLSACPQAAFRLTKAQVRKPTLERMRSGAERDAEMVEAWTGPETMARIREYVSQTLKRPRS